MVLSARVVAEPFVERMPRNQYMIFPGETGWVWRLVCILPRLTRRLLDWEYDRVRRRLRAVGRGRGR